MSRTFPSRSASDSTAPPRAVTSPSISSIVSLRATDTYSTVWMSGSCVVVVVVKASQASQVTLAASQ